MRNIARISRKEIIAHRQFETGMTASVPTCKIMDALGNKAWVADVYLGPATGNNVSVLKDVLIASTAKQLIGDIRQPVRLERSKQGKYTIVGRAEFIPAGAQSPEGSILEPTYRETSVNLADLDLLFLADLDYEVEPFGEGVFGEEGRALERINAWDAWGNQVMGEDVDPESIPPMLSATPRKVAVTRHVLVSLKPFGGIAEENFVYGVGAVGASYQKTIEHTE